MSDAQESAMALLRFMNAVATAAKLGDPRGLRFIEGGAMVIMPDGVAMYGQGKFIEVAAALARDELGRDAGTQTEFNAWMVSVADDVDRLAAIAGVPKGVFDA